MTQIPNLTRFLSVRRSTEGPERNVQTGASESSSASNSVKAETLSQYFRGFVLVLKFDLKAKLNVFFYSGASQISQTFIKGGRKDRNDRIN